MDQGLVIEASRSHLDTSHSVGLLWTSGQPDAEASAWQHATLATDTSIPLARFEPTIVTSQRPQTHAIDRAATGIGGS